jgi:hypothetical protein
MQSLCMPVTHNKAELRGVNVLTSGRTQCLERLGICMQQSNIPRMHSECLSPYSGLQKLWVLANKVFTELTFPWQWVFSEQSLSLKAA